jgi:8-oxo-dGTP pyrophosphatase MutT (NUDIX family)
MQTSRHRPPATDVTVQAIAHLDFTVAPWTWPFSTRRRTEIEAFFHALCKEKPALWNGRLLLLRDTCIAGATMSGSFFETDYASMLAAVTWEAMGERVRSCFPAAAVLSADGAFMLGEMAAHTQNAGQVLLPCGSVERGDARGGRLDPSTTLHRELLEETGLAADAFDAAPGWYAVSAGQLLPLVKVLRSAAPAEQLRQRICANLAGQRDPEFCNIVAVRRPADISDHVPLWVRAFLRYFWDTAAPATAPLVAGQVR